MTTTREVLVERFDRAADRLPELVAARRRRQRKLHGVEGSARSAPAAARARPEQRQRHGERVIHQHLLAGRDVELVGHQRLDQVPGQFRIAPGTAATTGKSPAFIGIAVLWRGADREGRHLVEEEVEAVVVVE